MCARTCFCQHAQHSSICKRTRSVFLHCSHIHHYHHHALSDELQGAVDAIVAVPVPVPVPAEVDLVVSSRRSWNVHGMLTELACAFPGMVICRRNPRPLSATGRHACHLPCNGYPHWRVAPMLCWHLWMQDIEPLLDSQGNPVTDSRGNPIPKVLNAANDFHNPTLCHGRQGIAALLHESVHGCHRVSEAALASCPDFTCTLPAGPYATLQTAAAATPIGQWQPFLAVACRPGACRQDVVRAYMQTPPSRQKNQMCTHVCFSVTDLQYLQDCM
jgi:hypothetical protein